MPAFCVTALDLSHLLRTKLGEEPIAAGEGKRAIGSSASTRGLGELQMCTTGQVRVRLIPCTAWIPETTIPLTDDGVGHNLPPRR